MKVYTNLHPVAKGFTSLNQNGEVNKNDLPETFDAGTVFKVLFIDNMGVILEAKGVAIPVNPELFNFAFKETTLDI